MTDSQGQLPILVIDDERDIRDGCERILNRRGWEVITAENGEQGMAVLSSRPVALTLLDLKMPGMDGMEVLTWIQANHPDVLVIILTGFATVETAIEAMKTGAYNLIPKPFQPDQLRLAVDRAMERKKLIDETAALKEERQRTLIDLDTEKSRTRTIIRTLPHGVAVTAHDGRVVLMNPAFNRLVGLEADVGPGGHISNYIPDAGLCDLVTEVTACSIDGSGREREYEWSVSDELFILAHCNQVSSEEGECLGAVLVLTDVTEWKMLDRLRTDFLAKVSHELRSPLSTIDLQLGLLLGDADPDEDMQERLLTRAKERTGGLIILIRDLLDMSRFELEADVQTRAPLQMEDILHQVVESLSPQATCRKHGLTLNLPDKPLPPVVADQASLESVFTNLVANAINYTPDGGQVTISAANRGEAVRVQISDTGFGIAPEHRDKIFDKFYRVKNEKTRYVVGTGLGLPIVKAVVEGLGGEIVLDSEVDKGTTFTIVLPVG